MKSILESIYGPDLGPVAYERLTTVLKAFGLLARPAGETPFSQADTVLITYGHTLTRHGERPLKSLHRFCNKHVAGIFSGIHILPFFPYSSDDGFSVIDFMQVQPELGDWNDIQAIGADFHLMVDLVANHISAQSPWFQAYLDQRVGYRELAIEIAPTADLSEVVRPRALPLLTPFDRRDGRRVYLWTTFSPDQVDLNYRSIEVLEAIVRVLLYYVSQGAELIRLDAIAYLWKQPGTACIHLPETHALVRLFRCILNLTAPHVKLVTETNVPHAENISYFGNGQNEAQMVYNFTLPPLLLHCLLSERSERFSEWVTTLSAPGPETTFFNFTASHDGIGVRPLEGILPRSEIVGLAERVRCNGGRVSEKQNTDGTTSTYELNTTYLDALRNSKSNPDTDPDYETASKPVSDDDSLWITRFLASQAIAMALPGLPGVYIHSLLGTRNWQEGVRRTGRARTINRAVLNADDIERSLTDPRHWRSRIFYPYCHMLNIRIAQPAFDPTAETRVLNLGHRILAFQRRCTGQTIYVLTNVSAQGIHTTLPGATGSAPWTDLLSGRAIDPGTIALSPYQSVWAAADFD